ncbi:MBL fold metallo-hydrolase [Desulforhopalus singaporensis]|nr:MBL fold metallo-hydrolase [Desulforhopalus singaporensis]
MTLPKQHIIDTPFRVGPVHVYTAELGGDLVLFDTGPPIPGAKKYLRDNIDLKKLKHIVITHCHIEHYGLASWLEKKSDATVYIASKDAVKIACHDRWIKELFLLLDSLGFSDSQLQEMERMVESGFLFPPFPGRYKIAEEDLPSRLGLQVLSCPGHSEGDLVYAGDGWAVTGDTLLRSMFQVPMLDIDLETGGRFENYRAYCRTLGKLLSLESKTVLPGHRYRLQSVRGTLTYYVSKLFTRIVQLFPYHPDDDLKGVIDHIFGERDPHIFDVYLKTSEVVFMRDFLAEPELLKDAMVQAGLFGEVAAQYDNLISLAKTKDNK